jgi:8-oxo-dGTP diphosphatase
MDRPKVGLGVVVIKDGKVLLHKRKGSGNGRWSFPDGHLEAGESFEECAKRETLEEAGIEIKNIKFVTATNDINLEENSHYITIYVAAEHASGEPKIMEPDRAEKWDWFSWNELPKPLFLPVENLIKTGFNPFRK